LQGGRAHDGCLLAVDSWRSLSRYQPAQSEPADVQLGLAWLELKPTTAPALAKNKPKPLQHYIRPDPSKQFELEVNASQIVTGAILYQRGPPIT